MSKFWQISTELRPLIDVRNWFSFSIFCIPLLIFFKQISTEFWPLIDVTNWFFTLYLRHFFTDFLQTLHEKV